MELFNFYQIASLFTSLIYESDVKKMVLVAAIVGISVWALMFILQGIGLYALGKNRGMKKKWLAFIPFGNIYYLGKIVGTCEFFGQKMKRAGLYTMLAQIVTGALTLAYIFAEAYLIFNFKPLTTELGTMYWVGLTGFAGVVNTFYEVGGYFMSVFSLVAQILLLILMIGFYKKYSPKNYRFMAILTFFIPMTRFIAVLALRNRPPFDYEGYMRRQREAYYQRQQQYYNQNPYNNPYGNPYNNPYGGQSPYGGYNNQQGQLPPKQEDPFAEFGEDKSSSQGKSTGDGFFDDKPDDGFFD